MKRTALAAIAALLFAAACSEGPAPAGPDLDLPTYGSEVPTNIFDLGLQHHSRSGMRTFALVVPGGVLNGGFESNGGPNSTVLDDWTTFNAGNGAVFAQAGTTSPLAGFPVPAPPEGSFAAMTSQTGPGQHIWYQDVAVPNARTELRFQLFIGNRAGTFVTAPTLSHTAGPNQQFRADVMDPAASVDDVGGGVLANVYQTMPGDPSISGYDQVVFDLTPWKGQTVRIRFAEVDNLFFFHAGTDDVLLLQLDPATKDECKKGGWEDFDFRNQGQCVRFIETGKDSRS